MVEGRSYHHGEAQDYEESLSYCWRFHFSCSSLRTTRRQSCSTQRHRVLLQTIDKSSMKDLIRSSWSLQETVFSITKIKNVKFKIAKAKKYFVIGTGILKVEVMLGILDNSLFKVWLSKNSHDWKRARKSYHCFVFRHYEEISMYIFIASSVQFEFEVSDSLTANFTKQQRQARQAITNVGITKFSHRTNVFFLVNFRDL